MKAQIHSKKRPSDFTYVFYLVFYHHYLEGQSEKIIHSTRSIKSSEEREDNVQVIKANNPRELKTSKRVKGQEKSMDEADWRTSCKVKDWSLASSKVQCLIYAEII